MTQTDLFKRGLEQLKAGNYDEARKLFRENEDKAGTSAATQGLVQNADAKLAAGDIPAASKLYEQALDRNPSLPEVYLGLTRIALFTGQVDEAKVHATAATKLAPRLGMAWTLMGLVHESREDVNGALEHLRKGAELSPNVFLCQFNYGRVLASAGRFPEAIVALSTATGLDAKNPDGFYTLGIAYKEAGQYEKALKAFEKAKDLNPKNVDAWATLADVLFSVKEFKAARDILDRGLKAVGEHPALLEKATACCMIMGSADDAIEYVERELKVVPDYPQAWLNLAALRLLTKEFDKSEAAAKTLLQKDPKNWEAWFHLGNLYEAVPAEKEAEDAYRKAASFSKDNWKVQMNLGALLVQSESKPKNTEAVSILEKTLPLAPKGEWRPTYNLALAFVRVGKQDKALELAKKIQKEAPPEDPMVAEAKKLESNLKEAKA